MSRKSSYTHTEVDILLAEQHRNTRHDAVEKMLGVYSDEFKDPVDLGAIISQIGSAIHNLRQRSPLPEKGKSFVMIKLSSQQEFPEYGESICYAEESDEFLVGYLHADGGVFVCET